MTRIYTTYLRSAFLAVVFLLTTAFSVVAEDISFETVIDTDRVVMGASAQLTLTLHGTQDLAQVVLPPLDGFEARFVGPSTQIKVVNGEYSTAKSFNYMLIPLKEGKYTIPAIAVQVKGQEYQSRPLIVEVVPAAAAPAGTAAPAASPAAAPLDDTQAIRERVQMTVALASTASYVYEEVPLVIKLYVRELPIQDITLPQINPEGFILSEFSRPKQYQEDVQGKMFEVVEFNALLTPTREGDISVGPAVITGSLLIKNNEKRNPFGGGVFDDEFFAGFFNSYQKKPITITARPLSLKVKSLPAEEKPADFSGGVGLFTFDVTASPLKVKAGDPVTLRMTVSGTGDLKAVKMPALKDERFKIYDPQIKAVAGQKTLEQVVVPLTPGTAQIPAINFSYFDTAAGKYTTLSRGPFTVEVLPMDKGQEFQAVGFADRPISLLKEKFGQDIVFVKDHPGRLVNKASWWGRNGWLLLVMTLYLNVWGLFYGIYLYRRKLVTDPGFARRSAAFSQARKEMSELKPLILEGGAREFYARLVKVLNSYLEHRINILPGNTDLTALETILLERKVPADKIAHLKDIFVLAERACFASVSVSVPEMQRCFFDMEDILDDIERRVK
ncbi:MAG: protein BatD [Candidatus Omnitrophica bacterium]|nr:protein BatD [Candidatus Omnitrophota bacterium]